MPLFQAHVDLGCYLVDRIMGASPCTDYLKLAETSQGPALGHLFPEVVYFQALQGSHDLTVVASIAAVFEGPASTIAWF